jgi:hypothetical protein
MSGKIALYLLLGLMMICTLFTLRWDFTDERHEGYNYLGILSFGLIAFVSVAAWMLRGGRRLAAYVCILLSYLLAYGILSAKGDYVYSCSGQSRYDFGLSFPDQLIWTPKGLYWQSAASIDGGHNTRCTVLGAFYFPLISIDRQWIHRDKKL